jgi:hypothetical protein
MITRETHEDTWTAAVPVTLHDRGATPAGTTTLQTRLRHYKQDGSIATRSDGTASFVFNVTAETQLAAERLSRMLVANVLFDEGFSINTSTIHIDQIDLKPQ